MSISVLIGYATRYGSTREIAEAVAAAQREIGLKVEIQSMKEIRSLEGYEGIIPGAPLFMFRWHKDALRFLSRHRKTLLGIPVAVFAPGPVPESDIRDWAAIREWAKEISIKLQSV